MAYNNSHKYEISRLSKLIQAKSAELNNAYSRSNTPYQYDDRPVSNAQDYNSLTEYPDPYETSELAANEYSHGHDLAHDYGVEISPLRRELHKVSGLPSHYIVPHSPIEQEAMGAWNNIYSTTPLPELNPILEDTKVLRTLATKNPGILRKLLSSLRGL